MVAKVMPGESSFSPKIFPVSLLDLRLSLLLHKDGSSRRKVVPVLAVLGIQI